MMTALAPANLEQLRDIDEHFPTWIPFSLRVTQISGRDISTAAIMLYVGKAHVKPMEEILNRQPFSIEIVPMALRRKNRQQFERQLELHSVICTNSQAIKITEASLSFQEVLRKKVEDTPAVSNIVLDVADSSNRGVLFVQCMPKDKPTLTAWLNKFIGDYTSDKPDENPTIPTRERSPPADDHIVRWSKHQYLLDDDTYRSKPTPDKPTRQATSTSRSWRHLPSIILTSEHKSYASVASNHDNNSHISSPTNSVATEKHPPDKNPWAHKMDTMQQEIDALRAEAASWKGDASQAASESSRKSTREIALEDLVSKLNETLQAQTQRETALLQQLNQQALAQTERETAFLAQIAQQAKTHQDEIADIKNTHFHMLETLAKMSQQLDGMSPPRKRSARYRQHDDESCSISVDTRSRQQDDDSHFTATPSQDSTRNNRGEISGIQDISLIHPTSQDKDCTMNSVHTRSQDFDNPSQC
jgi:hypothetical protein